MSKISSWTLVVIVSLLLVVPVNAQVVTSNLQGFVTDTSGAIVPGAKVTAVNVETGESRETTTNEEGLYRFNLLPRGRYEVRVAKAGFAVETLKGLNLYVGDTLTANLALHLAGQAETVSVSSEASQVDLASSQIQGHVQQLQIATLPINDRNFQQLANLIPGVASAPSYDPTKRLYGGVVSGGATARSSGISVDGGNFNDNIVGGPVGLVPEDAIQEFQVITNQFSAEYGHSSGPFVNVVTKSGTNQYHGTAFGLFRHKDLQARGFFEPTKPDFSRHFFLILRGAPIIKDKTFGFFAIERNRQEKAQTVNTAGIFPQFEGSFPAPFRDLLMVSRLDHHFNRDHTFSFRATFQRNTSREGLRIDPNISVGGAPTDSAFQVATNENISWQGMHTWVVSPTTVNQFTLHFNRFINELNPTSFGINLRFPSVVVGQNASTPQGVQQDRLQFRDDFTTIVNGHGTHNLKFGVDMNPRIKYNALFDLFKNGVFVFGADVPTLTCSSPNSCNMNLPPGTPSPLLFALKGLGSTRENGTTVWQMAYYFQDDWKIHRRLTLNLGLRYEYESGFVIYYDSTPWEISYIDRTFDGVKYLFGVFSPSQPDLNDPAFSASQTPGGFAINGNIHQPYTEQFSITVGQELPRGIVLDVSYAHILGVHGWMTRELNPQGTRTDGTVVPPRFPGLGLFSSFETLNLAHYDALLISARKDLTNRVQFQASYTLSKAESFSDDIFEPGVPQNSDNLAADNGPTLRDARHRFVLSGIVRLPLGFETSTIAALQSGRPYNITTGTDDNGDGHLKDRPAGVGRNAGRAAPTYIWDLRVARPIRIREQARIIPTLDIFNVVNHPNFDAESYIGALSAGSAFGKPTDIISPPRQLQLGVKFVF